MLCSGVNLDAWPRAMAKARSTGSHLTSGGEDLDAVPQRYEYLL